MNKNMLLRSQKLVFFAFLVCTFFLNAEASEFEKKPNFVLIMSDDQGYGDFSIHGNPQLKTPNLDALAIEGARLSDFHVDPTCSPTRASLMTGRYASKTGVWLTFAGRNHLHKEEKTMADVFKHNGYKTGIFGKWHLGDNYPFRPQDRGFDESFIHGGGVAGEVPDYWANNYFDDVYFENGVATPTQGYTTDVWFEKAKQFILDSDDKPFFVYIPVNTPHGPFNVNAEYSDQYQKMGVPETRARFYGMIETIDENVGGFRRFLKENKLEENTLVIYLTDNGTSKGFEGPTNGHPIGGFNANMRGRKTSAYEGGHRAASFWYWPAGNMVGNKQFDSLTSHIDLLPTLVDLFDLKLADDIQFDGTSLRSVFNGKPSLTLNQRSVIVHNQARFGQPLGDGELIKYKDYAVMHNKWRLVGKALYNISNDPSQKRDVSAQYPELVKKLSRQYEDWWQEIRVGERLAPTILNPGKQKELLLTAQAWTGDKATYDQSHIIAGVKHRGYWYVDVEVPGTYRIEFSRWPKEAKLGFNEAYKRPNIAGLDPNFELYQFKSRKLAVDSVEFLHNKKSVGKKIIQTESQKAAVFEMDLAKGLHTFEALMHEKSGQITSAYYMYITPLNNKHSHSPKYEHDAPSSEDDQRS